MLLATKSNKNSYARHHYPHNTLYDNYIQKSLILALFATTTMTICKQAKDKEVCCQEYSST